MQIKFHNFVFVNKNDGIRWVQFKWTGNANNFNTFFNWFTQFTIIAISRAKLAVRKWHFSWLPKTTQWIAIRKRTMVEKNQNSAMHPSPIQTAQSSDLSLEINMKYIDAYRHLAQPKNIVVLLHPQGLCDVTVQIFLFVCLYVISWGTTLILVIPKPQRNDFFQFPGQMEARVHPKIESCPRARENI